MYTGQGKRIGMLYVLHILVMCTQQYFSYSVYEHFLGVLPGASETPFLGLHEIVAYTFHDINKMIILAMYGDTILSCTL